MPPNDVPNLTNLGRRLKHKVHLAITLAGVLPLLVLAYVVHSYVLPSLGAGDPRRFFTMRLDEELARYRRFNHPASVVLMDLDGFKAINDDLGHPVGDETLRDIAQILQKHSRGINVISRYGGDEFAVLLVETSKAGAKLYAERIRQVIGAFPFSHGKQLTASLGVASVPDDEATTAQDLFRAADEALYAAKRAGKNQVAAASGSPAKVS